MVTLPTQWSTVLHVKATGPQIIQIFPAFYGTTVFIMEHALAQLVEALRYKPEGHGFDS